jgi:hypothetical protein
MEFDKSRVYTAVNADELRIGDRVILGDSLSELREEVEAEKEAAIQNLMIIHGENMSFRFTGDKYHSGRSLAYLIEPPAEPKYKPFESVDKAMEAIKAHGRYVIKTNNMMSAFLVTEDDKDQGESKIFIDGYWYSLQELYRLFVFADDDSPCGELVEE